ncbi:chemotaxis protein CheA [Aliterella atlantica]|uniref:chemotaxis protein CheA n=1 Tax=Aliterella atlantica TaxID=1827278 RepID=UPI0006991EFA|nr:ATP-binding protein [Aliterella atlantica]
MIYDSSAYAQAYACFLTEAPELMQTLEQDLLTLQEDRSCDKIYSLMRAAHTLKSVVASLGFTEIEKIAHALEDVFNALYDPTCEIDSELESLLFQAFESLRLLLNAQSAQIVIDPDPICDRADEIFARIGQKLGDVLGRETYLPTQAELKTDITRSIFAGAIAEDLSALEEALRQPNSAHLAATLRKKAKVFLSLAEGLNLPGFAAIAQTTIAALTAHPDRAATIARIALADFQQGKALVLAGDRTWGGKPSVTLQQFAIAPNQLPPERSTFVQSKLSPLPPVLAPQTIRVDLERLNRLKYSTGGLIVNQNQQDSAKKRLEKTVQKFRTSFEQHQQTLNQIRETLNQIRARPRIEQDIATTPNLNGLMQSAMEESAQLEESLVQVELVHQQWSQALADQQQIVTLIQDNLTEAQMAPLGDVFNRFVLVLQRLVTVYSKPAELKLSGTQIIVDKAIAEKLYEPLLHLVRNAFAHGIEPRAQRQQQGKPDIGQIQILAREQERELFIEVADDGAGLDCDRIRERAVQWGILSQAEATEQSDLEIQQLLFEPGFSTSAPVSELSGRGFGLEIVRSALQAMQGSIQVQSIPQKGTTFTMQIPLLPVIAPLPTFSRVEQRELLMVDNVGESSIPASLDDIFANPPLDIPLADRSELIFPTLEVDASSALSLSCPLSERSLKTAQLLIWASASLIFFLPYSKIEENLPYKPQQRIQSQNQWFFHWRNQMLQLYPLIELLNSDRSLAVEHKANSGLASVLIIRYEQQLIAIEAAIKHLITKPEIVLQPPRNSVRSPVYIAGYAQLETNELVPAIDVETLIAQTALNNS